MHPITRFFIIIIGITLIDADLELPFEQLQIRGSPGIYFESLPKVYQVMEHWKLVGKIDIRAIKNLQDISAGMNFGKMFIQCQNMITSCDRIMNIDKSLERERRIAAEIQNLEEIVHHYPEINQSNDGQKDW